MVHGKRMQQNDGESVPRGLEIELNVVTSDLHSRTPAKIRSTARVGETGLCRIRAVSRKYAQRCDTTFLSAYPNPHGQELWLPNIDIALLPVRLYCSCTQLILNGMGLYLRGRSFRLGGSTGTWRVVFSSTGDLSPARGAVRHGEQRSRMWIEAARRPLRCALDTFAALVLPSDCRICNQPLTRFLPIPVCDQCLRALAPAEIHACTICGEALDFSSADAPVVCAVCRRVHPRFDYAISFGSYDGALRSLLHLLKYERLRPVANVLGARLAQAIVGRGVIEKHSVLTIPVPLHRAKRRQRGLNQTELIARSAVRHLERSRFELQNGLLRRVRATVSQTGLTRHQRRQNPRGFAGQRSGARA